MDQPGTSFFKEENDKEFSVRYIPLDDPLQPVHLAKVKMELPDDLEMGGINHSQLFLAYNSVDHKKYFCF